MSKIAVIGSNGKVARFLIDKLVALKPTFQPTACFRNPAQKETFESIGANTLLLSVTDPVSVITKKLVGYDAVVFSAGAGGKGGLENTLAVDLDGAVKVMEAAEQAGVKRFIMVSALLADNRDFFYKISLKNYYICKMYADRELQRTNLDYTILRPGVLMDTPATTSLLTQKTISGLNEEGMRGHNISREDVANVIVEVLKDTSGATSRKIISLLNGDELPLKDLVSDVSK